MIEKLRVVSATTKLFLWTEFGAKPRNFFRALKSDNPAEENRKWFDLSDRVQKIVLGLDNDFAPLSNSAALKIHLELLRSGFKKL